MNNIFLDQPIASDIIDKLMAFDVKIFFGINQTHNPVADWILWVLSQGWSWAILLLGIFAVVTLRKSPRTWFLILIGIALCFLFPDRVSVMCFKEVFMRLRPCHALEGVRLFDNHCGGQFGFISSHATNAFALAMFFSLTYKNIKYFPLMMISWAVLVAYSRPYLGVHYPGDILCGAIVGTGLGCLVYFLVSKLKQLLERKFNMQF